MKEALGIGDRQAYIDTGERGDSPTRLNSTPAGKIPPNRNREKFANSLRNTRKWEKKWSKNQFSIEIFKSKA